MAARLARMSRQTVWSICGLASVAACDRSTDSAPAAGQAAAPPQCERLASLELPDMTVTLAELVPAGAFVPPDQQLPAQRPADYGGLPAFCRFAATIAPTEDSIIKVEVWLPVEGWNGKLVGVGNGGLAGAIFHFAMAEPLARGFAVASTDTGHEGGLADAGFAVGHPDKLVDFSWRAVREMTIKAKAVVAASYGTPARRSYWVGCSSGGRQGLKEAQRFPEDYDGISAGAPANNWLPLMAHSVKIQGAVTATGLAPPQLALLKEGAIAACDARDGVTDRVVNDPRTCSFDPGTLQCGSSGAASCLTLEQLAAARSIYAGVTNPRTNETIFPGPTPGSELQWSAYAPNAFPIGANYWRDVVAADPNADVANIDFDAELARALAADLAGPAVTTVDANLAPFAARGGKLLLWHGWTDGLISAQNTIDYYEDVVATTGAATVKDSVRLFMLPGVDHCAGGEGAFVFDALGVLDAWVEDGRAPERIVASRPAAGGAERVRPLCPYPTVAKYDGAGNTDDAASFACGPAAP
jgi:tannase/feruloyl esterase